MTAIAIQTREDLAKTKQGDLVTLVSFGETGLVLDEFEGPTVQLRYVLIRNGEEILIKPYFGRQGDTKIRLANGDLIGPTAHVKNSGDFGKYDAMLMEAGI